ncbi:MAG: hypothetical protein Q4E16_06515 [Neisseria sp.]|nr:hypothetical protein [Neisseria sp.]
MLAEQKRLAYLQVLSQNLASQPASQPADINALYLQQVLQHRTQYSALPALNLNSCFQIHRHHEHAPWVIFFQGMYESHIAPYFQNDPELQNLSQLNDSSLPFSFQSFIKTHTEFNYICVKDNFQSWYLLHFEYYLAALLQILPQVQAQEIITVGCSAGASAAILFGHYLEASKTIAFAPQLKMYHLHHVNAYRHKLNQRYRLGELALADLARLHQQHQGFAQKVHIVQAAQNESDWIELNFIPWRQDSRISTTFFAEQEHDLFSVMDKEYLFRWLKMMLSE